jgi:stage VI sporulation protein D
LTQDHSSKLSFSIEESVWLNKGQEVDEIVSLSLDPEITVQENGDYVLIRGGLKLTGEYRSNENNRSTEEENSTLSNQVAFRSIEEVTLNADGTGEIKHYFPIDVTIPQDRINSLDEIYVIVESFDYDLPERGCIQLTADVAITGMSTKKIPNVVEEEVRSYQEEIDNENVEQESRTFHFEAYSEPESDEPRLEVEHIEDVEANDFQQAIVNLDNEAERAEEVQVQLELSEEVVEVEQKLEIKPPSVAFGVIKDRPKQEVTVEVTEQLEEKKDQPFSMLKSLAGERKTKQVKQAQAVQKDRNNVDVKGEVKVTQVEVQLEKEVPETKPQKEENALYLTKMLTKGEEDFKKLKICIIRENETLDTIAARYEVNQSTLIRVNRLDNANVEEGQILYIPVPQ